MMDCLIEKERNNQKMKKCRVVNIFYVVFLYELALSYEWTKAKEDCLINYYIKFGAPINELAETLPVWAVAASEVSFTLSCIYIYIYNNNYSNSEY